MWIRINDELINLTIVSHIETIPGDGQLPRLYFYNKVSAPIIVRFNSEEEVGRALNAIRELVNIKVQLGK